MEITSLVVLIFMISSVESSDRKNVLFIMADDMRPEIATYKEDGDSMYPKIQTPNLDEFAKESALFTRSYTSQALCCPSRTSLMTGRRPDTTKIFSEGFWRTEGGNFTTIPQHFKNQGYVSIGMGKIYHPGAESGSDDPLSWSEDYYHAPNKGLYSKTTSSWAAIGDRRLSNYPLPDQQLAEYAKETLTRLAPDAVDGTQPFFLALGFYKPHLPFTFPESYLDYYPEDDLNLAENLYAPENMPEIAWSSYNELIAYQDITDDGVTGDFNTSLSNTRALELRRAYYAAVTYIDDMIGEVLTSLEDNGLADSTIVVFCSDHGWQLGEHSEWAKQTNFELAVRTPLMVRVPGVTDVDTNTVTSISNLVELVDLFPTIVDAAGLDSISLCPEDSSEVAVCHEGMSLLPLIQGNDPDWRDASFSWYQRRSGGVMGYTMRTADYRYTEWVKFDTSTFEPTWTRSFGTELYDHITDPEENYNVADDSNYSDVIAELSPRLQAGWRSSIPGANARRSEQKPNLSASEKRELLNLLKDYLKGTK